MIDFNKREVSTKAFEEECKSNRALWICNVAGKITLVITVICVLLIAIEFLILSIPVILLTLKSNRIKQQIRSNYLHL